MDRLTSVGLRSVAPRRRRSLVGAVALLVASLLMVGADPVRAGAAEVPAAIQTGVDNAAQYGVTQYVVALDRGTGQLLGSTANADQQVGSESIMKLFLAAYYLRAYGGTLPAQMNNDLWYMILVSDDAIASAYWTADAIGSIAAAYGLLNTSNNPGRAGYWGAAHITARDVATFLWRASQDPLVGPWLFGAMANTTDLGSDGYDQNFGFNAIAGAGSKQGWGCDSYWVGPCAIHSVGFTDSVIAAVLQTGPSGATGVMPATATVTATGIVTAAATPRWTLPGRDNPEGAFTLSQVNGVVTVDGWAFDGSDLLWTVPVMFTVNGVPSFYSTAALPSPELAPYGIPGSHHLTTSWRPPNTGSYQICMFLGNVGAGSSQLVQCADLSLPADPTRDDPTGYLAATVDYAGTITVTGYAYDPSNLYQSVPVWIADNGRLAGALVANAAAPSLAPYGVPGAHGISYQYPAPEVGRHDVCLYTINIGWGKNTWPSCARVDFPADHDRDDPQGDMAVAAVSGGATVSGWAFDKNNLYASITTMFTVDGAPAAYFNADQPADYLRAYGVPGNHGVAGFVPMSPGTHYVCMFTFNIGYGSNQLNRCASVVVA